jgi:hypothetical protein
VPAHPVAAPQKARAEHVVGAPVGDWLEERLEVGRRVLAVAVEVDGGAVSLVAGELEAGAKRGAQAAGGFVRDDPGAVDPADRGRCVARAVVDEQPVDRDAAGPRRDARQHGADGPLLVAGDDDGEAALPRAGGPRSRRLHGRVERG